MPLIGDHFSITPELVDVSMVKNIMDRYYHEVTRYTANTFLQARLARY